MMQAIRSMAPDIIVCDEIGSNEDAAAIEHSINCGVTLVATVHASSETELRQKENIRSIVKMGAFGKIVFLSNKDSPGKIVKIAEAGDVFGT